MMSHRDDIKRHRDDARRRVRDVFVASVQEVQDSITIGSALTGAPGSPVDTGELKGSWTPRFIPEGGWYWRTVSDKPYARFIEEGGYTQRSTVGGPHSIKLTRTGWPNIVRWYARQYGTGLRFRP